MSTHSTKEEEEREMGEGEKTSGGVRGDYNFDEENSGHYGVNCQSLHRQKRHYLCQFLNCSQTRHTQPRPPVSKGLITSKLHDNKTQYLDVNEC